MKPSRTWGLVFLRILVVASALLSLNYIVWRWTSSVNWANWWISLPLVSAETYSVVASLLFGFTLWRLHRRPAPPPAPDDLTVDVVVSAHDEPVEMVLATARAAKAIDYPHTTWIVHDGDRPQLDRAAVSDGIRVLTRPAASIDELRREAGALSDAMLATDGEFMLILNADQVPEPTILDDTLGYFVDEQMALIQTPVHLVDVPAGDPYGSRAPVFHGPIHRGKDGWNAAQFCGSSAVVRREALAQLGVRAYAESVERNVIQTVEAAARLVRKARLTVREPEPRVTAALDAITDAVYAAEDELRIRRPLGEIIYSFRHRVDAVARDLILSDLDAIRADLADLELESMLAVPEFDEARMDSEALETLVQGDVSPLGAISSVQRLADSIDTVPDDAGGSPAPNAAATVADEMSTCLRLHAAGWRTAYHRDVLARGVSNGDLSSVLTRRLSRAQGAIQVMFVDNPLLKRGLTGPQRLMYWATIWNYFSGFAALVYCIAPAVYLAFGTAPIRAYDAAFLWHLIPVLVVNQILFLAVTRKTSTWRSRQYQFALFPLWIRACTAAFRNIRIGDPATSAAATGPARPPWHLVRWQLVMMVMLAMALVVGAIQFSRGDGSVVGMSMNMLWVIFDFALLSVVIRAVRFRPE